MSLVITKTYAANTILTETDLDNIRNALLTQVNTTKVSETFLDLDSIAQALTEVQASSILNIAQSTQADSLIGIADAASVEELRSKRASFFSSGFELRQSVPPNTQTGFTLLDLSTAPRGAYLISVQATINYRWLTTRTTSLPPVGSNIEADIGISVGAPQFGDVPDLAPFVSRDQPNILDYIFRLVNAPAEVLLISISGSPARIAQSRPYYAQFNFIANSEYLEAADYTDPRIRLEAKFDNQASPSGGTILESEVVINCGFNYSVWRVV